MRCLCVCVQAQGKPLPQESCHPLLRPLTPTWRTSVFLNPAPLPWRPQGSPYPSNDTLASRWAWPHSGPGRVRRGCWMCGGAPRSDRAAEWGGDRVQHMNAPGVPESPRPQCWEGAPRADQRTARESGPFRPPQAALVARSRPRLSGSGAPSAVGGVGARAGGGTWRQCLLPPPGGSTEACCLRQAGGSGSSWGSRGPGPRLLFSEGHEDPE